MHGFKPSPHAQPEYASGGVIDSIKRRLGFTPVPGETARPSQPMGSGPQEAASAPQPAREYMSPADRRMREAEKASGFKVGGTTGRRNMVDPVEPGAVEILDGPGTGTSDSIPAEMTNGTHILPKKTTDEVLLSDGEAAVSPEVVSQVGQAALDALRIATNGQQSASTAGPAASPVGTMQNPVEASPRGFKPWDEPEDALPRFAVGGTVDDEERRRRALAQIPLASGANNVPNGQPVVGDDFSRNVANTLSAVPGAAGAARGFNALNSMRVGTQVAGAASPALGAVLPYAAPAAGAVGLGMAASMDGRPAVTAPVAPQMQVGAPPPSATVAPGTAPGPAVGTAPAVTQMGEQGAAPANNITRVGNSYSATGPITASGMTINGREPGGGFMVAPAAPAAAAPAAPAFQPPTPFMGSGGSFGFRRDPRIVMDEMASIANYNRSMGADPTSRRLASENARSQSRDAVDMDRNRVADRSNQAQEQISQGRLANESAEGTRRNRLADMSIAQAEQVAAAQKAVLAATTPNARKAAEDNLRALQGNYQQPNRLIVVPGAKNADGSQDASTVYDSSTGQPVQPQGQQGASKSPYAEGQVLKGKDGKTYVVKNGQPVPQ